MDVVQVIDKYGVPVGMLLVLIVTLYHMGRWFANVVAEPVVKKHLEFMDKVASALQTQTELLSVIHADQTKFVELLTALNRSLDDQTKIINGQGQAMYARFEQMEELLSRSEPRRK